MARDLQARFPNRERERFDLDYKSWSQTLTLFYSQIRSLSSLRSATVEQQKAFNLRTLWNFLFVRLPLLICEVTSLPKFKRV